MSRHTKRMKTSHGSTAAYAASQPLFDALRFGVERTSEQNALLVEARDIVQHTHVKLAESLTDAETRPQSVYMESVVKAWQSATQSFAEIFDALGKATAAVPSEGKEARDGHDEFVKMAATAAEANGVANEFKISGSHSEEGEAQNGEPSESASEDGSVERPPNIAAPHQRLLFSKTGKQGAKNRQRIEESRQKREKKLLALRAKKKQTEKSNGVNGHDATTTAPQVEYEDISAEVEARLKAKDAKREAAKKEKKRKRESGESFNSVAAADGDVAKRPARKKSKSNGVIDDSERDIVAVKEKRKSDSTGVADVGGGKRKKAKTKS